MITASSKVGNQPLPVTGYLSPGESRWFGKHMEFDDSEGTVAVAYNGEPFDTATHPFFQKMPNGRACVTCHQPVNAMSISVETLKRRWVATAGKDPVFNASDGANCPNLPQADPKSHSLLLERGLFRISLPWPPKRPNAQPIDPEFSIEVVSDPTGCNTSPVYGLHSANPRISVFRRPRMAGNTRFVASRILTYNPKTGAPLDKDPATGEHSSMTLMADARVFSLHGQAADAAAIHMGMSDKGMTPAQLRAVLDFESKVHVAQQSSKVGLRFEGRGTPKALGVRAMAQGEPGLNGNDRDSGVFFMFNEWKNGGQGGKEAVADYKASVARGYDVFFLKPIWIRDTFGINHITLGNPYKQTCAFCHNTQLTGHDDVPGWMDLGTNNFPFANSAPDLPLFRVTCKASARPHPFQGREIYTYDPGRALISGRCVDVGAVVMQQFRGMAARAPYFVNGTAKSIREVVDYYDRRYYIGYTDQEKEDLINFLGSL